MPAPDRLRTSGSGSGSLGPTSTGPALAVAPGAKGIGPVSEPAQLAGAVRRGVRAVTDGLVCVIDARLEPGYGADVSEESARGEPGSARSGSDAAW